MKDKNTELNWAGIDKLAAEIRASGGPGSNEWDMDNSHTKGFNEAFIKALRENKGKVPGELEAAMALILTTTGAKTGKERVVPLACHLTEGRLLVAASMGGSDRNPPWFHNVVSHPEVLVEKDGDTFPAMAVVTEGEDRNSLFQQICENVPTFADYQSRTRRQIPVVELKRR
ncbi:MAG: nitroreductase/quinone reductase family protein [Porticoccaceae bacterium]